MFAIYTLRTAAPADRRAVEKLARLDSQAPLRGDVLLAEDDGRPVAAMSLDDRRVVADPFVPTACAVALLRERAEHLHPDRRRKRHRRAALLLARA